MAYLSGLKLEIIMPRNLTFLLSLLSLIPLVLGLAGCASSSNDAQVTGRVTYLQRIALPQDAVVVVRLENISRADAPAEIIVEKKIETEGRQVPIPFELPYNPESINDKDTYNVNARILDGQGTLLFISDTVVPVITRDNPKSDIEVIVVPVG